MAKKDKQAGGGTGLNMDIDINAIKEKIKNGRGPKMPSKTTMNLVVKEAGDKSKQTDIIMYTVSALILIVFLYVGVWQVYQKKVAKQAEVDQATQEYETDQATLARYADLSERYSHYYFAFLTDEELSTVNRLELMDMLGTELFSEAALKDISVDKNMVTINFNDVTLDQAGQLAERLSENEMVSNVDVSTTTTYEEDGAGKLNKVINVAVVLEVKNDWLDNINSDESSTEEGAES